MTHYFLFGFDACQELLHEGEESLLKYTEHNFDWDVYKYTEGKSSPVDLLSSFVGWDGSVAITEELYNKLVGIPL